MSTRMVAFLSGANEYGTPNDYVRHCAAERAFPALRQNASATEAWHACKARLAVAEAHRILAQVEPAQWSASLGGYFSDFWTRIPAKDLSNTYAPALASALSAFLQTADIMEGEALGDVLADGILGSL